MARQQLWDAVWLLAIAPPPLVEAKALPPVAMKMPCRLEVRKIAAQDHARRHAASGHPGASACYQRPPAAPGMALRQHAVQRPAWGQLGSRCCCLACRKRAQPMQPSAVVPRQGAASASARCWTGPIPGSPAHSGVTQQHHPPMRMPPKSGLTTEVVAVGVRTPRAVGCRF